MYTESIHVNKFLFVFLSLIFLQGSQTRKEEEEEGMTEDEMVRWHHQLNGYEF